MKNEWIDTNALAEKLRNEHYLMGQGYRKKRCKCRDETRIHAWSIDFCFRCKGRGWVWEAPLMR